MDENIAISVAETLSEALSEFHALGNETLRVVRSLYDEESLVRVIFVFDRMALSVWCESGDDSIAFKVTPSAEADIGSSIDTSHFEHWKSVIGKSFGWGWITINQQGYCDGLLISFEGTHPQLLLTGMASSLAVSIVARTVD